MATQNGEWTGSFVAQNKILRNHHNVEDVALLAPQVLKIVRKEHPPFLAGTIAADRVERPTIEPLLVGKFEIEIIANVPKESYWTGEAIEFASNHSVAFGGFSDLLSAILFPNVRQYVRKEFDFVERGLRQHRRVQELERIHDRLYGVKRKGLPDVTVVLLNEYELTADHVRTARERYGDFSDVVITNPNGKATSSAQLAAESMDAQIHGWGGFLSRLHKP